MPVLLNLHLVDDGQKSGPKFGKARCFGAFRPWIPVADRGLEQSIRSLDISWGPFFLLLFFPFPA